jgi:hypothetical protein
MTDTTIATQVAAFDEGFTAQIGPTLSAVFAEEQRDLRAAGVPADAVSVGQRLPDATLLDPAGEAVSLDTLAPAPRSCSSSTAARGAPTAT